MNKILIFIFGGIIPTFIVCCFVSCLAIVYVNNNGHVTGYEGLAMYPISLGCAIIGFPVIISVVYMIQLVKSNEMQSNNNDKKRDIIAYVISIIINSIIAGIFGIILTR